MTSGPWPAPRATRPVDAVVEVPGSKSVTNRALVLAALSPGESVVRRPLHSRDTALMVGGLRALGVGVAASGIDLRITGDGPPFSVPSETAGVPAATIDVGNAGTVARFLPPLAALSRGRIEIDGDPRIRERPLGPLLTALRTLGVTLDDGGRGGLPLTVTGRGAVPGGRVTVDASLSSQLVSGLLLAAPAYEAGIELHHEGARLPSRPHIAMTVRMLRAAGASVDDTAPDVWRVAPVVLRAPAIEVEPDLSSAAPFLAAALVTGGRVTVPWWPRQTDQPGAVLPDLLSGMGATCTLTGTGLTVRGGGRILGLDADLGDVGELTPVLAALAALAEGPSRLRGVAHLRGQETDRLAALAAEIGALGGAVAEAPDGLTITPRPLHGGVFATYDDHRLAMAAAVLGLAVDGVRIENVATTDKTLPGFPDRWVGMLG